MAKDKDKFRDSTTQNREAGAEKIDSQKQEQNGLKEPLVTNTPQEDKSMTDSDANKAKAAARKEVTDELYATLKSGEEYPGYTIVPAKNAEENPTVDKVVSVHGQDAVVKLKAGSRNNLQQAQLGRSLGLVENGDE